MWFNKYKTILSNDGARDLTDVENLLGGMSAGCFSTLGNNPFDVVKTKMQGIDASKYNGTLDCFRKVSCVTDMKAGQESNCAPSAACFFK